MSWRRFCVLLRGLSWDSVYRHITSASGQSSRPLRAADAPAFFASFPKAGEK